MNDLVSSVLAPLRFAKFEFILEATEKLHLPPYKGSTLRGGFGNAFKKAVCMTRTYDCPPCLVQANCPYFTVFESRVEKRVADLLRIGRDAPHPFVLEPPLTEEQAFHKGDQLNVGVVLIGNAMEMLPSFVYAFMVLGERVGLGTGKGKFSLRRVNDADGNTVYDGKTKSVRASYRVHSFSDVANGSPSVSRLALHFITPTRIMTSYGTDSRHLMRLRTADDFWTFIESLYHRLFVLTHLYCADTIEAYVEHKLPLHSTPLSLVQAAIRWHDWERYSNRQQTRMKLGGFIGDVVVEGELGRLVPLLRVGEYLHVGKNSSFGLGKFVVAGAV